MVDIWTVLKATKEIGGRIDFILFNTVLWGVIIISARFYCKRRGEDVRFNFLKVGLFIFIFFMLSLVSLNIQLRFGDSWKYSGALAFFILVNIPLWIYASHEKKKQSKAA